MQKNIDDLKETNPGKAFRILKQMGAQPGDCGENNTFVLSSHEIEGLSTEQSAERIATHFSEISQQYPPLNVNLLPERVVTKLQGKCTVPVLEDYQVFEKIKCAKKPHSGVPGDLPRLITKEFSPELATPINRIISSIVRTGEWPAQWKQEWVTPISKIPIPISEDDLRPISLTPFFSKVTEHFVVMWLLEIVKDSIDFRQYGGIKGNSITHYLIEFINFILSNQDSTAPIAILACMVDYSKAFNRMDHNILVTKLSDLGVAGWLLKIVMAFLSDRSMIVRYQGKQSSSKYLPGGGPQGTLLGLLLFLIMINDLGFEDQKNNAGELITRKNNLKAANTIHLKFVDDLTLAESINLKENLVHIPDSVRPLPDALHAQTGHVLPLEKSKVFQELLKTEEFSKKNSMEINTKKTKVMVFNPCKKWDFIPELSLGNQELEMKDKLKLLGVIIRSDLKWTSNTEEMVKKGYKRLWALRRLKGMGASLENLKDIFVKQVRSVLELAVPAWNAALTENDKKNIERVQKTALRIMLGLEYTDYRSALDHVGLESLELRRQRLSLKFAKKCAAHPKHKEWFRVNFKTVNTRQGKPKYCPVYSNHTRFDKSPISYLTNLLNEDAMK